jgi:hypothetical protein
VMMMINPLKSDSTSMTTANYFFSNLYAVFVPSSLPRGFFYYW